MDMSLIFRFYRSVDFYKIDDLLSETIFNTLNILHNPDKLQDFLVKKQNIRFFFIIMLWDKLFLKENYVKVLLNFASMVTEHQKVKATLERWSEAFPREYIAIQVERLLKILEFQFVKLEPGNMEA